VHLTRWALVLGAIPVVIGLIYLVTLLVALGLAMGFGMLVILRGARDL
jgi:hypothetical protein